jgi:hypothetical protein
MTKDNASGAGMKHIKSWRDRLPCPFAEADAWDRLTAALSEISDLRTDATRLLAESQAHNAKLEAQVERMREALSDVLAIAILQPELHYLDNDIGTQTPDGIALLKARAALQS